MVLGDVGGLQGNSSVVCDGSAFADFFRLPPLTLNKVSELNHKAAAILS